MHAQRFALSRINFPHCALLSLYSTRTQNTWRRGLALASAADARILRYPTQNIPTCWYLWRWMTPIFRVGHVHFFCFVYISFASGGQREPHFQWNIGGVGSSGVGHVHFMYISCCLCIIFRVGYAKISRRRGKFQWNMGFNILHQRCLSQVNRNKRKKPEW